jgi:hypothetical protein
MKLHRTAFAALAAILLAIPALAFAAGDDDKVAALIAQSRIAVGGAAVDRGGVLELDSNVSAAGLRGTARSWNEIGGLRLGESFVTPPLSGADGYDGNDVWNGDGSGLVWVEGGTAGRTAEIVQAYVGDYALWTKNRGGAAVSWGGTKTDAGVAYDSLLVTPPQAAAPCEIWFDRATHLPARVVLSNVGTSSYVTTFSDYRSAGGLMVPYATRTESQGNVTNSTVTAATAGVPGGEAHLVQPASTVHDFSIAKGLAQTSVPFQLIENHVYLNVMLNGKGPYRFIFDTGGLNLIDPAVAKAIGANGSGDAQGSGIGATTESIAFADVDALQVGDATLTHQLFFVAPTRAGFGMSAGLPVDGLIGFEVLARFVTTFDYGAHRVILQLHGANPPAGAGIVPMVISGKTPQFPCGLAGIAAQCTLDTGSRQSVTLYAPFMAAHPQVVPATASAAGVNGFGFGGAALGKLGRIDSLQIGAFTIPDPVTDFTTMDAGALAAPFLGANVGGGVWKRFALTLDYTAHTIALVPNGAFGSPDVYERAGLFLIDRNGAMLVVDSRPGTPASEAGIVKGDTIVSIDGKPTSSMTLQDVRQYFFGAPGTVLQLAIASKDGTKRSVALTLRDFV